MEIKKLICFLDGDALCIVKKDFVNIQESPSVFLSLTKEQIKEINKIMRENKKDNYDAEAHEACYPRY